MNHKPRWVLITLTVKEMSFEFTNSFFQDPQCAQPTVKFVSVGELAKHGSLVEEGRLIAGGTPNGAWLSKTALAYW